MTRSKIFLALTTSCLAIAAVAATKANKFTNKRGFYFTENTPSTARQYTAPCAKLGSLTCKVVISGNAYTLYTATTLVNPIKYATE